MSTNAVDIYVELSGKEKYHTNLKGRDEANQHPISAITNLQGSLDDLDDKIDTTKTELSEDIDSTQNLINNLDEKVTLDLAQINEKIEELEGEISGGTSELEERIDVIENDLDQLDTELNARLTEITSQINAEIAELSDEVDTKINTVKTEFDSKLTNTIRWKGSVRTFNYLPTTGQVVGDMYNVEDTDDNYFWTGLAWDKFAGHTSHEEFATKQYVDGAITTLTEAIDQELDSDYYNRTQINNLIKDVMNFRGVLSHESDLDNINPKAGYFYKVIENNQSYIGTGTEWIEICGAAESYSKEQVDALLALKASKEELQTVKTSLEGSISTINTELATKATKTELAALKTEIEEELSTVYKFKGSVPTYADLPSTGNKTGDIYNVEDTGMNYAWDGTKWDNLGSLIDLSQYAKETEIVELRGLINNKADKSELANVLTKDNLGDTLKAGSGVVLSEENNIYTISVTQQSIEPVIEVIVSQQINEVKEDVQINSVSIAELKDEVKELKWKTIDDVLSST